MSDPSESVLGDVAEAVFPTPTEDRVKAGDIKSLEGLLAFAYEQQGKRFSVPLSALKALPQRREEASDTESGRDPCLDLILERSSDDPLLLVPPRLLIAVEDGGAPVPLRRRVAALVTEALRRHPVFQGDELQLALTTEPPRTDQLFQTLASVARRISPQHLGIQAEKLKSSERDKLLANATTALALVLAIRDRWSLDQFVECLHANLWRTARRTGAREPRALLADSRTPDALALVADVFDARARTAEAQANEFEEYSRRASQRAFEAAAALDAGNRRLEEHSRETELLLARVKELEEALSSEQRSRVVDRSHHVDDYETLRTRVVRMLDRLTDLLADGLHALRHGSTGVADEYLERAVDALSKERDQLRAEEAGEQ